MPYIKFTNDLKPYRGKIERIAANLAKVILDEPIAVNTSGFRTYRDYEMLIQLGDFEDFKTLYSEDFVLSNDGSTTLVIEVKSEQQEVIESVKERTLIASEVGTVSAYGNSSVAKMNVENKQPCEIFVFLSHACNNNTDFKLEVSGTALKEYEIVKELRSTSAKSTSNFLLLKVTTKGSGELSFHSSSPLSTSTSNIIAFA